MIALQQCVAIGAVAGALAPLALHAAEPDPALLGTGVSVALPLPVAGSGVGVGV